MQLPSPMMDLKTGAMQSLRLTTLMTSLQAVVLRKISSLDGKKNKKTSEDEDGSSIEHGSLLGGFICFHLLINLFIYSIIFYLFIYFFISIYSILFLPLNMDAMITEFECNSFRSVNQNCQAKHH